MIAMYEQIPLPESIAMETGESLVPLSAFLIDGKAYFIVADDECYALATDPDDEGLYARTYRWPHEAAAALAALIAEDHGSHGADA